MPSFLQDWTRAESKMDWSQPHIRSCSSAPQHVWSTCHYLGHSWVKTLPPKPHRLPYYFIPTEGTDSQPQTWSHRVLASGRTLSLVTVDGLLSAE